MAIIEDIGMTQEEVLSVLEPAPAGEYEVTLTGFLKTEDGKFVHATKKGGRMVKAKLRIDSADPKANGKTVIHMGVLGTFGFAMLTKVFPIMSGTGITEEEAIGRSCKASVTVEKYTNPETGDTNMSNKIGKLWAI
jgi:hypothetical protein